jgi:hypothetical protein
MLRLFANSFYNISAKWQSKRVSERERERNYHEKKKFSSFKVVSAHKI